ncbi:hypothetical protein [Kaistia sp. MMO-174]|uniref:hypothetical protein n=1 Tax=Kaistia sp. MMO-174 TaxID=3081256 RepID=UPI0030164178
MPLRSPFDAIAAAARDGRGASAAGSPYARSSRDRYRAVAMARKHPEELGVVLRLVAVMAFFAAMATLLFWLAR